MRRVSSRQRLVSWDAFDATLNDSDFSDSEYSDNDVVIGTRDLSSEKYAEEVGDLVMTKLHATGTTVGSFSFDSSESRCTQTTGSDQFPMQRRKRSRRKNHGPTMVPSHSHELSSTAEKCHRAAPTKELRMDDLIEDVHFMIFSFLDVEGLQSAMGLNHKYRSLIQSEESFMSIWNQLYMQQWPMMKSVLESTELVDSYNIPTAKTYPSNPVREHPLNLPLLLRMAPVNSPTTVDESLLNHPNVDVSALRPSTRRVALLLVQSRAPTNLEVYRPVDDNENDDDCLSKVPLIRYTGAIGAGDRCIRADKPLPRPKRKIRKPFSLLDGQAGKLAMSSPHVSLLDLFCRGARAVSTHHMTEWQPFVSPYLQADGSWQMTPRMVAYYEVSILAKTDVKNEEEDLSPRLPTSFRRSSSGDNECVAVGLATQSFHIHSRMPGWDSLSFGYHGDDGGIFHSSGGMVERFGPTFGAGDTVGCGIDYVERGIFFTLNGKFLGYGWKNIDREYLHNDLYPVVGIDTNAPVSLNFGCDKPFAFDLKEFRQKHALLIQSQYRFSTPSRGLGKRGNRVSLGSSVSQSAIATCS